MGLNFAPDLGTGIDQLVSAAEGGEYSARLEFALIFATGSEVTQDDQRSNHELDHLGETMGPWVAATSYEATGRIAHRDTRHSKAVAWYERAAKLGDVQAYAALGDILRARRLDDLYLVRAFEFYAAAAQLGVAAGHWGMGDMLLAGEGQAADPRRAHRHLLKAARGGNERAMIAIAESFRDGRGIDPDARQALYWLEEAARREIPSAPRLIGNLYLSGAIPHTKPRVAALGQYLVAALFRDPAGERKAQSVAASLRPEERKSAQLLAEEFLRTVTR